MDDRELLGKYCAGGDGDQEAFAALVRRHAGWVYGAARRQLRDEHLAEDVMQAVFVLLARKARGLQRHPNLGGWLFSTLRYCVGHVRRQKVRQQRREREAAMMRNEAGSGEANWETVAPELDGAVGALGKADREAVLLRFYQRMPLAEVGTVLGVSEAAAQKRVGRAVERLRGILEKKGVPAGAGALGVMMAEKVAESVPARVVEAVAAAGGGTGSAVASGAARMMAWAKVKVAAVVLLGLGLAAGVVGAAQGRGFGAPAAPASAPLPAPAPPPAPALVASRTAGERVLAFPAGIALGTLYVREDREYEYAANGWEYLAPAAGEVRVAAGKQVELRVSAEGLERLAALGAMPVDAFYSVSLAYTPADDTAVTEVARLTGLRSFSAFRTNVTDRAGASLRKLTALEDLDLTNTEAGAECMAATEGMGNLRSLAVCATQVQGGLQHLAGKKQLRLLDLGRTQIGDAELEMLGELPELRWLRLRSTRVTDRGLRQVAKWKSLEVLDLTDTAVGDDGMAVLSDLPGLKELQIAQTKVTDAGMRDVAAIRTLEKLVLPVEITNPGLGALAGHPKLKEIEGNVGMDDASLGILAEMPALESIALQGKGITDAGMGHVAEMRSLRKLALSDCAVGDAGFARLASLGSLEDLSVWEGTRITVQGLAPLANVKELRLLRIGESRLLRGGLRYAAGLPRLTTLCLQGGDMVLDDAVLDDVGELAGLESLIVQNFGTPSGQITDEGVAHLAKLARLQQLNLDTPGRLTNQSLIALSKLEELLFVQMHGRFTDEGLRALEGRPKLRIVRIPGTFSEAAKAELRRKTPSLQELDVLER